MKKKLAELKAKRAELLEKSKRAEISNEDLKLILDEIQKINESIALIEEICNATQEEPTQEEPTQDEPTQDEPTNEPDSSSRSKRFSPVFTQTGNTVKTEEEKRSLEYRKAFRNLVTRNIPIPMELRASTQSTDVVDVIPENLIAQIIDKSKDVGMIFEQVQHTSYPVGQEIPIANFRPTVQYVTEGSGNTTQKAGTTNGRIKFSHYKVDCRIAWTEETDVMTLDVWENYFVEKVVEAIMYWKENEIINGTGTSAITGVLSKTPEFQIKKDLRTALNSYIFMPSTSSYLSEINATLNSIMQKYKTAGGVSSFKVVCDATNNTSATLQQDIINASISCVPVGTIEQINIDCSLNKSSESVSVA